MKFILTRHTFALQMAHLTFLYELPGGRMEDYHSAIVITSYSDCIELSKEVVKSTLHQNVSSTIGDRVAVIPCVVQKLAETFGKQLVEFNCNLHPVQGLARQTLKQLCLRCVTDRTHV